MDSDIKILKLLLTNKEKIFTINQLSKSLNINYRIAYEQVNLLEKSGILKVEKIGNSKICEFIYKFNNQVYEAEYLRRIELFKNKDFLIIRNRLAELNFVFIALLFGSHVKGTANKHSDIDILAIGGDESEIKKALSLLPDKIHLTTIAYKDFINMIKSKEFTVVSEVMKNNIILIGIEEYYRLLENAGYKKN